MRWSQFHLQTAHARVGHAGVLPGDQRIAIRGVTWDLYSRLVDAVSEDQHLKLAFDGRDIEIMTTSFLHERFKRLLGRLVEIITEELAIAFAGGGETTWKRDDLERGLESDQCYYFLPEKLSAVAEAAARQSNDINDYPNPDLAVEIDLSPSQVDRPGIYAALRVTEVWRFDGETMLFETLRPDDYLRADRGEPFPSHPPRRGSPLGKPGRGDRRVGLGSQAPCLGRAELTLAGFRLNPRHADKLAHVGIPTDARRGDGGAGDPRRRAGVLHRSDSS